MPALMQSAIQRSYQYRGWLTVVPEPVVMTGTLSATPSFPALTLAYTVASGSHAAIETGMEVEISSSGTVKGRLRVAPGTISATSLPVNEFDAGRLNAAAGDTVTVLRSWRLRDRLVAANATFDRDSRVTYSDQNEVVAPIANAGGPWAGWVDPGQTYATVTLNGSLSATVDPDSGGTLTYLWDVDDGTITVGTSTSSNPTVRFPVGSRWVKLTVTDSSNSATAVKYVPVIVHGTGNLPHEVVVTEMSGTRRDGWSASFELPAGADLDDLPDGALIIYHEDEHYGGSLISYGSYVSGRGRIKFVGYVVEDSIAVDAETNTVSFSAQNPMALLNELPGFSQAVSAIADPSSWLEYQTGLSVFRMMIYILRWGTTFLDVHDLLRAGTDRTYPRFYLQQATPLAQLQELAEGNDCELLCDRTGMLTIAQDLQLQPSASRAASTVGGVLTSDDRVSIRVRRPHRFTTAQLEARGLTSNADPVLSRVPAAPAEGAGFVAQERLIVDSQDNLNIRAGMRFARANRINYGNPAPAVEAELPGGYDVYDFFAEWTQVTLAAASNKRGVALTDARCVIERISIEHDTEQGAKRVRLSVQTETDGPAGTTYIPPNSDATGLSGLTQYDYGTLITFPTPIASPIPLWNGTNQTPLTIYAAQAGGSKVARGTGVTDGSLSWTDIDGGSLSGNGTWGWSDPFNYKRFYVLTTDGLYKTDDKTVATPSWSLVASSATMMGASGRYAYDGTMHHNRQGWIAVVSGFYICTSTDYGATWNQYPTSPFNNSYETSATQASALRTRLKIGNFNTLANGVLWAVVEDVEVGPGYRQRLRKSTDWGQTWSDSIVYSVGERSGATGPGSLSVPYRRSVGVDNRYGDGHEMLWIGGNNTSAFASSVITSSGAETFDTTLAVAPTGYLPHGYNVNVAVIAHNRQLHQFTANGNKVAVVPSGTFGSALFATSVDGGVTWTDRGVVPGTMRIANVNGFSLHDSFYIVWAGWNPVGGSATLPYGGRGGLQVTVDDGVTWFGSAPTGWADGAVAYAEADLSAFQ